MSTFTPVGGLRRRYSDAGVLEALVDHDNQSVAPVLVNGALVDGAGISFLRGSLASGVWMTPPSMFRLRITGTGTLQMDSRDSLGNITLATFPLTTYTGETDKIEFPYAGDDAVAIRVTLTGTLTCEVI
jgi:hypothetical protein